MKWIKVEDKLPEEHENVLLHSGGYVGFSIGYSRNDKFYRQWDGCELNPKFWMPLPEPPKEK